MPGTRPGPVALARTGADTLRFEGWRLTRHAVALRPGGAEIELYAIRDGGFALALTLDPPGEPRRRRAAQVADLAAAISLLEDFVAEECGGDGSGREDGRDGGAGQPASGLPRPMAELGRRIRRFRLARAVSALSADSLADWTARLAPAAPHPAPAAGARPRKTGGRRTPLA